MTSNEILKAELIDIIFENRNKSYGAYALRKNYNSRLGLSLAIGLSLMLLLFLLFRPGNAGPPIDRKATDVIISEFVLPPDKIKEIPPELPKNPTPRKQFAEQLFTTPDIKDDNLVDGTMADQSSLKNSVISDRNVDSDILSGDEIKPDEKKAPVVPEVKEKEAVPMIQSEPEFPGGMKAWMNFLNRHLVVPGELEAGEKKSVMIRFKVAEDGSVTGFEILQSAGKEYDHEVMRVLKKMPKWKPAIQNNQPVARSFTQPVTFMGLSD